jgi:cyclopropane-fatty-acyl-phospholipid synthase
LTRHRIKNKLHATGLTLSSEQAQRARQLAQSAGVDDRVRILDLDYREISGSFDAIASVGMYEHVGRQRLDEYFRQVRRLMAPGAQALNHGLVRTVPDESPPSTSFVRNYVFPDGDIRTLEELVTSSVRAGLDVRDVESLRASYALTLRHWVRNLEHERDSAMELVGPEVYRIWRLDMAGSAVAFERNAISVVQMLLSDPLRSWTFGRRRLIAADELSTRLEHDIAEVNSIAGSAVALGTP